MIGGMRAAIAAIEESASTPLPYFEPGAAVTELTWTMFDQHRPIPAHPGGATGSTSAWSCAAPRPRPASAIGTAPRPASRPASSRSCS